MQEPIIPPQKRQRSLAGPSIRQICFNLLRDHLSLNHIGPTYIRNNQTLEYIIMGINLYLAQRYPLNIKGANCTTGQYLVDTSTVCTTSAWCLHHDDHVHEGRYYDDVITASQIATLDLSIINEVNTRQHTRWWYIYYTRPHVWS